MVGKKDIDIVVVNYKRYDLTRLFLESFYDNKPKADYTITVVDNESDLASLELLADDFPAEVDYTPSLENIGYAQACNLGASFGNAKYIGLFNNDIEFVNGRCLDICIDFMNKNPDVGIVGPFQYTINEQNKELVTNAGILGPRDKPAHRGWMELNKGQYRFNQEVLMVMGSAMIISREYWNKILRDPIFLRFFPNALGAMPHTPLYYEDTMLCYAAEHFGYKVFYLGQPGCELIHHWHQTIKNHPESEPKFHQSRSIFRNIMDAWGIEHD